MILFAMMSLAQFQAAPTKLAMDCVHWIYCYLCGTLNLGIFIPFRKGNAPMHFTLTPYSDASFPFQFSILALHQDWFSS
jgi:hypothetical protein